MPEQAPPMVAMAKEHEMSEVHELDPEPIPGQSPGRFGVSFHMRAPEPGEEVNSEMTITPEGGGDDTVLGVVPEYGINFADARYLVPVADFLEADRAMQSRMPRNEDGSVPFHFLAHVIFEAYRKMKADGRAIQVGRVCPECHSVFKPGRSDQTYCCRRCSGRRRMRLLNQRRRAGVDRHGVPRGVLGGGWPGRAGMRSEGGRGGTGEGVKRPHGGGDGDR